MMSTQHHTMCKLLKYTFIVSLSVLFTPNNYGQDNTSQWFFIETSVTGDFLMNMQGGLQTEQTYLGMEELCVSIDLEKLKIWQGGRIFLHGLNTHGITPSSEIVGDLQVSSNIESGNFTGLYEYYFHQSLGDLSFIFGQHDLNSEFVGTEYGGTFINSSFGISPSIAINVPVSIYPFAAPALIMKYEKENKYAARMGIYDGDPGDPESNRYNLQPNISLDEGLFLIGEFEKYHLINNLPESFKIGGYYHTNNFLNYTDTLKNEVGNYGIYSNADLVLWSGFNHPDSYLGLFFQGGWAPDHINQIDYYLGAGIHLNGVLPQRFKDALGVAFAYANIGEPYRKLKPMLEKKELAIEFTYKIHVFEHYIIQPNLQYIINPGAYSNLKNALVGLIRFNISL